jgi:RNA polymerase sigma-70 factor (ECF subfamily)
VVASVLESDLAPRALVHSDARLRACVAAHLKCVWRMLRRHGVSDMDADDAAQRVFLVLSRKLDGVEPGHELPYLLRTAVFVASETRRAQRRRRESPMAPPDIAAPAWHAPDAILEHREALEAIDAILEHMDESLRTVFVLHEIEELTMAQIAETLQVPPGTVASRLRRARSEFQALCEGGSP